MSTVGSITMNKDQSIEEAGRVWRNTVTEIPAIRMRLRAEMEARFEAEVEALTKIRREAAARAIHYAIDHGATKTALRQVTTKDHWDFEGYVALGNELAAKEES